jgi:hypothetical protein
VFVDDSAKRTRCAELLGDEIAKALASSSNSKGDEHKVDERFPRNLREIRIVQRRFRKRLLKVRKALRAKVKVRSLVLFGRSTLTWCAGVRGERQRLPPRIGEEAQARCACPPHIATTVSRTP